MENILTIFGKSLRNARMAIKNLKQADVADAIGIQRTTYTNWESKTTIDVDKDTYKKLVKLLEIQDDALIRPHEKEKLDILDHPVIKSLVEQSTYIMARVHELEAENKLLRGEK